MVEEESQNLINDETIPEFQEYIEVIMDIFEERNPNESGE